MEHKPISSISSLAHMQDSKDIVNAFDVDHRVLFWNKGCEDLFKIKREQAIGRVLEDLLPYVKTDRRNDVFYRAFRGQKIHVLKEKYKFSEGYYEQKIIPLKDEAGKVYAVVNLVRALPDVV